ncbi:uncharacterized protein CLUP02_10047 [Colletotrichum lupini]|uniref:Uncharacterized protein n=1 Tax=Colletotrichum lupini TaxID=145971 RepID=A0A9Q8SWT1_9PEZI|nr:uncharacterized protein CLUP02_10047 [Colletotrichum lupini]UQC84550.1 hypothetical protein CLUP02_10047 [Colletotrichum lupini]
MELQEVEVDGGVEELFQSASVRCSCCRSVQIESVSTELAGVQRQQQLVVSVPTGPPQAHACASTFSTATRLSRIDYQPSFGASQLHHIPSRTTLSRLETTVA